MPIKPLVLQRRLTEVGRIRIGEVKPTSNGKTRPAKLDRFRFTSPDKTLLEQIASLYGGTVEQWTPQGGGASQWEVLTDASSIPVVVPPEPISQFLELWSGGGCTRRCDGERELKSGDNCLCAADDDMVCKPTTRLSVMLRDVESIGVFRLESHGWNAAAELPGMAELLARAGGYIDGRLYLKPVRSIANGQTRDFMVPALAVDGLTPKQLLAGSASLSAVQGGRSQQAIEAAPSSSVPSDAEIRKMLAAAPDVATLKALWAKARDDGWPVWVEQACKDRATEITAHGRDDKSANASPDAGDDPDAIWLQIVAASPFDTSSELEADFAAKSGGITPATASAGELAAYLRQLRGAA